jgi:hypothetical protein
MPIPIPKHEPIAHSLFSPLRDGKPRHLTQQEDIAGQQIIHEAASRETPGGFFRWKKRLLYFSPLIL